MKWANHNKKINLKEKNSSSWITSISEDLCVGSEHLSGSISAASAFSSTASFSSAGVSACPFAAFSPGLGRAFKILHLQGAFWGVLMHNRAISSVCSLLSSRLMPPSTILCCVKLCSLTSFLNFELFYEGFSCGSVWFSRYPNRQNKSLE